MAPSTRVERTIEAAPVRSVSQVRTAPSRRASRRCFRRGLGPGENDKNDNRIFYRFIADPSAEDGFREYVHFYPGPEDCALCHTRPAGPTVEAVSLVLLAVRIIINSARLSSLLMV